MTKQTFNENLEEINNSLKISKQEYQQLKSKREQAKQTFDIKFLQATKEQFEKLDKLKNEFENYQTSLTESKQSNNFTNKKQPLTLEGARQILTENLLQAYKNSTQEEQ